MPRLLLALLLAAPLFATDPAEIRKAAEEVAKSEDVQRQLPDGADTTADAPHFDREDRMLGAPIELPGAVAGAPAAVWHFLQFIVIGLAVMAVVALLLSWLAEARLAGRPLVVPAASARPGSAPVSATPDQLLALADEYAAAGQFPEAMHQVLLAATAMLQAPDSLTSWELLRASSLAPPARRALQKLISRVERAWFGKQPAGPEDYRSARGIFGEFAAEAAAKA
jgi:hypothetical protein